MLRPYRSRFDLELGQLASSGFASLTLDGPHISPRSQAIGEAEWDHSNASRPARDPQSRRGSSGLPCAPAPRTPRRLVVDHQTWSGINRSFITTLNTLQCLRRTGSITCHAIRGGDPPSGTLEGRQDEFRELADSFDVMAHTARSARRRTDRRACARCSRPNDRRWAFLRSMNLRDAGFVLSGARLAGRPFSEAGSSEPSVRSAIL